LWVHKLIIFTCIHTHVLDMYVRIHDGDRWTRPKHLALVIQAINGSFVWWQHIEKYWSVMTLRDNLHYKNDQDCLTLKLQTLWKFETCGISRTMTRHTLKDRDLLQHCAEYIKICPVWNEFLFLYGQGWLLNKTEFERNSLLCICVHSLDCWFSDFWCSEHPLDISFAVTLSRISVLTWNV